jgi:hypothetical protein
MLTNNYNIIGKIINLNKNFIWIFVFSERRNSRNSRDRLLEEQNAAYLDSVRADQEKVC